MKSYEMGVKAAKKEFNSASTAAVSCHPAQLSRVIRSLISFTERTQDVSNSALSCEVFVSFFAENSCCSATVSQPMGVTVPGATFGFGL